MFMTTVLSTIYKGCCSDCLAFGSYDEDRNISGECRRHAPVVLKAGNMPEFPEVEADTWCLEHLPASMATEVTQP